MKDTVTNEEKEVLIAKAIKEEIHRLNELKNDKIVKKYIDKVQLGV